MAAMAAMPGMPAWQLRKHMAAMPVWQHNSYPSMVA